MCYFNLVFIKAEDDKVRVTNSVSTFLRLHYCLGILPLADHVVATSHNILDVHSTVHIIMTSNVVTNCLLKGYGRRRLLFLVAGLSPEATDKFFQEFLWKTLVSKI